MNDRAPIRDRTLILRILVPGLEARLRDKMKEMEDVASGVTGNNSNNGVGGGGSSNNNNKSNANTASTKDSYLDLEGVTCEPTAVRNCTLWNFHCDGATYPAKLVNLPCPVEVHKTHDHAVYYKSADIAQMLIVYEDDMALEEAEEKPVEGFPSYYHSGLTPPTRRIVERKYAAREHKAEAPPRAAVAIVENELVELMEKLAKDDKGKRNKVPTLTSATKDLIEVEDEVVDYEPWMSNNGREPKGIEFDSEDQLCSKHPEVWLSPADIREIKELDDEAKRKKDAAAHRKEAKRKDKKDKAATEKSTKKGIPSKKNSEYVDEVTQAATSVLAGDDFDIMNDDDLLNLEDLEEDMVHFEGLEFS